MTTASCTARLYILLPLLVFVGGLVHLSPELADTVRASCQAQCRQLWEVAAKMTPNIFRP